MTEGNIHIDGIMRGIIRANEVVIGPNGEFDGEIIADILIINGTIKGMKSDLEKIKNKFLKALKNKEELKKNQLNKISSQLHVNNKLTERVDSFIPM